MILMISCWIGVCAKSKYLHRGGWEVSRFQTLFDRHQPRITCINPKLSVSSNYHHPNLQMPARKGPNQNNSAQPYLKLPGREFDKLQMIPGRNGLHLNTCLQHSKRQARLAFTWMAIGNLHPTIPTQNWITVIKMVTSSAECLLMTFSNEAPLSYS